MPDDNVRTIGAVHDEDGRRVPVDVDYDNVVILGCISCGAEIDHYLGCPDDPDPDYEAEAQLQERGGW